MNQSELITSDVTGKQYDPKKVCRLVNPVQVALYMKHNAELLDVYPSVDYESGKPILCFIVSREQTRQLYDLWCKRELN